MGHCLFRSHTTGARGSFCSIHSLPQFLFINSTTTGLKTRDFTIMLLSLTGFASARNFSWKEQNLGLFLQVLLNTLKTYWNQPGRVSRKSWRWASKRISPHGPCRLCRACRVAGLPGWVVISEHAAGLQYREPAMNQSTAVINNSWQLLSGAPSSWDTLRIFHPIEICHLQWGLWYAALRPASGVG